jgi:hypothetical protein
VAHRVGDVPLAQKSRLDLRVERKLGVKNLHGQAISRDADHRTSDLANHLQSIEQVCDATKHPRPVAFAELRLADAVLPVSFRDDDV